ncbi:hypothetical protein ACXYMU_15545 [Pontibacter sp. CAU 1760]
MEKIQELWTSTNKLYLTIYHEKQNNIIYNNWSGYVTSENVKNGAFAVLEALKKYKSSNVLNNNKELLGRWDHTVEWIEQDWTPRAIEAGLRNFAHIVDCDTFAAASAADMLRRVEGRYTMRIFHEEQEGRAWLRASEA